MRSSRARFEVLVLSNCTFLAMGGHRASLHRSSRLSDKRLFKATPLAILTMPDLCLPSSRGNARRKLDTAGSLEKTYPYIIRIDRGLCTYPLYTRMPFPGTFKTRGLYSRASETSLTHN